jgi:hypothetical protein
MDTNEMLRGTTAITAALNELGHSLTERQTSHLIATGAIPTWKTGGRVESSRTVLRKFYEDRQAQALARALGKQPDAA